MALSLEPAFEERRQDRLGPRHPAPGLAGPKTAQLAWVELLGPIGCRPAAKLGGPGLTNRATRAGSSLVQLPIDGSKDEASRLRALATQLLMVVLFEGTHQVREKQIE